MSEYRVNLDIFAGPLDLLLYLVRREEVDIYDIPIARVTEQYVKYIEILRQLDIDLAGDFLVMAAALMEIKSIMLLPASQDEEQGLDEAIDPRSELVRQLLEYKKFKDAANLLKSAAQDRSFRHSRPDSVVASLEPEKEPELDIDNVNVWMLLEAFDNIMQSVGDYQNYEHILDDTPIDFYQILILHRLQSEGAMAIESIFADANDRIVMIGMFLALLELVRDQLIFAAPPDVTGVIRLRSLTDEPAEQAVHNTIYAKTIMEDVPPPTEQSQRDDGSQTQTIQENEETSSTHVPVPAPAPVQTQAPIPIMELPPKSARSGKDKDSASETARRLRPTEKI